MNKAVKKIDTGQTQNLCVYAVMPFMDCYCQNISGSTISKIARYCMEDNSDCPVYKKIVANKINRAG